MSCGKRPLVKDWDKPKNIRVITPSRYEQDEASVKQHWKKVIRDLEMSYKDEQFWDSQCDTVRELVGPVIFQRIAKIFNLPADAKKYVPKSDITSLVPSEQYYKCVSESRIQLNPTYSISDFELSVEEESVANEQSELWSTSSLRSDSMEFKKGARKSVARTKSFNISKSISRQVPAKSASKFTPTLSKSLKSIRGNSSRFMSIRSEMRSGGTDESANSEDDLKVHPISVLGKSKYSKRDMINPHFTMLYCNKSETDMIKWKSKYKQKTFEVSASDEFSKKAEIMTKQISTEFYDWWVSLGNVEFKSEIKRPGDIEDLFQVWFDEHASRGLVLDPKILPCVLQSVANYVGVPQASCPRVLKRQIAYDIHAEISPAHTTAFNTSLPQHLKHIPPNNSTKEIWHSLKIPEDLRSMACVWDDIQHLTSTKAFQSWLQQRPHLPMPPCLKPDEAAAEKKQLFVVPSDYVVKDRSSSSSAQELALPVSQFSLELKEVLSKLLNQ
ncbi:hypothetical protein evm_012244 [Chilo suppressalis]|nr:hypothetical protein evm_012244 [Chilo suppressalis]